MDLETRSPANLTEVGARGYLRHPDTELLCACFGLPDRILLWVPGKSPATLVGDMWPRGRPEPRRVVVVNTELQVPSEIQVAIAEGATFAAHNAEGFDALAWERLVPGPQPTWYDTIHLARQAGLPAGLDRCSHALGLPGKDPDGKRAMHLLAHPNARGEFNVGTPALWKALLSYNIGDVLDLEAIIKATSPCEIPVLLKHAEINERGIKVDLRFAANLRELWNRLKERAGQEFSAASEGELTPDNARSPTKVKAWLKTKGLEITSLERKGVEAMIADPEGFFGEHDDPRVIQIVEVLTQRQDAVRSTAAKVNRLFTATDPDGRMRGTIIYHGAHTGRYSARGFQPHNLPRGVKEGIQELIERYETHGVITLEDVDELRGKARTADVLATLMRPCLVGDDLLIGDFAQIEARAVGWLSTDRKLVDLFANPGADPYCAMASALYRRTITKADAAERFLGKQIILGCGYQMGKNRFGATCKLLGVQMPGVTPEQCVNAYRTEYPLVVNMWYGLDRAAKDAMRGAGPQRSGRITLANDCGHLVMILPSGRKLRYRNARVELVAPKWDPAQRIEVVTYDSQHGYRKELYGGLLMENASQATTRDLMCHAKVCLQLPVVMHVHDEILAEGHTPGLHTLAMTMSIGPDWSRGFPIKVEAFQSKRYVKSPFKGAPAVVYQDGVEL